MDPRATARRHPLRAVRALLLAAVMLLGVATPAHALVTLTNDGTTFTAVDDAIGDQPSFTYISGTGKVDVRSYSGVTEPVTNACVVSAIAYTLSCDMGTATNFALKMADGPDTPAIDVCMPSMSFDLGNGDNSIILPSCGATARLSYTGGNGADRVSLGYGNTAPTTVNLGDGNDVLNGSVGSAGPLTVDGGPGDDRLDGGAGNDAINGGDGNDAIKGLTGNDVLNGGVGDDVFDNGDEDKGNDEFIGGPGTDKIYFDAKGSGVNVSLDDAANDGQSAEADNVHSDIEAISGSNYGDTIVGTANPDSIDANGGDDIVSGGGGDDTLYGGSGNDTIGGGPGNDTIQGDGGNDTLDGGTGRDNLTGDTGSCSSAGCAGGNDTLLARDGEQDSVNCGLGADIAQVDSIDVLPTDPLQQCESVDSSAALVTNPGAPSKGAGGTTTPGTTTTTPTPFTATVTGKPSPTKGAAVHVSCTSACQISATLGVTKSNAKKYKLGTKAVTIGSAKATLLAAGAKPITVSLTKAAKAKLAKVKKLTVTLTITVTDASGKATSTTQTITLKK